MNINRKAIKYFEIQDQLHYLKYELNKIVVFNNKDTIIPSFLYLIDFLLNLKT